MSKLYNCTCSQKCPDLNPPSESLLLELESLPFSDPPNPMLKRPLVLAICTIFCVSAPQIVSLVLLLDTWVGHLSGDLFFKLFCVVALLLLICVFDLRPTSALKFSYLHIHYLASLIDWKLAFCFIIFYEINVSSGIQVKRVFSLPACSQFLSDLENFALSLGKPSFMCIPLLTSWNPTSCLIYYVFVFLSSLWFHYQVPLCWYSSS